MKNNVTLREIGEKLNNAETIAVLPHLSVDGDGLGASIALCRSLRAAGKECHVVLEEGVPDYVAFLNCEYVTTDRGIFDAPEGEGANLDAAICVDCSEDNRIPGRVELFNSAKTRLCIDHHLVKEGYGDCYYIDEKSAAASELIYMLIDEMGWELDLDAATALYTGIVTDTGCFQYSNTTSRTHNIGGALIDAGVNVNDVSVALYQNVPLNQIKVENRILETLEIFADGKASVAYVKQSLLDEMHASVDDTEKVIDILRNISGVEVAVFLKERNGAIKVSMRAKTTGNVQQIAAKFNGGGHVKAAGCTLHEDIETAKAMLMEAVAESLR